MLYGFGEQGFNAHRFVFNSLEEPIQMIKHDLLYCVHFKGQSIPFWPDVSKFADELAKLFPDEKDNILRFYRDMSKLYHHVLVETPNYTTPDETDPKLALKSFLRHPLSYIRFLSYLNKSAKEVLSKYFSNPEIFQFFDKMTSTYCYATVEEAPAILAAVMFVDNHVGGSYYPAGSTLFVPGKLEKVIEENGGDMLLQREVETIVFEAEEITGVKLTTGEVIRAPNIIYAGTVWNLYGKLIESIHSTEERREWAKRQEPTYPSVVLYAVVDRAVIPDGTLPIEMLIGNPAALDESEVTVYISSIDDQTLCPADVHVIMAIGPSFEDWATMDKNAYQTAKDREQHRLIQVLERRFPGISQSIHYAEVATPSTIERYTLKNGGAVAGPKQKIGQHMFHRLHTRTEWPNLYCCGESTVMGTGTPTVTTSGLSAANALLKDLGKETFVYRPGMTQYVNEVTKPFTRDQLFSDYSDSEKKIMNEAFRCRFCEDPPVPIVK